MQRYPSLNDKSPVDAMEAARWREVLALVATRKFSVLRRARDASAATRADSGNRRRDKRKVEKRLGLLEGGEARRELRERDGRPLASGYEGVVYGDHGAYVEVSDAQLGFRSGDFGARFELRCHGDYYDLYKSKTTATELYRQTRTVADRPNPPRGRDSARRDRREGYADYRVGLWYVSPKCLVVDGRTMAPAAAGAPSKAVGRGDAMLRAAAAAGLFRLRSVDGVVARCPGARGRKYRFRRLDAATLARDARVDVDACVSIRAWRRDDGGGGGDATARDVLLVTVEPSASAAAASPLVAAARRLGLGAGHAALAATLRRASTSDVERATNWPRNYEALPLAPEAPASAIVLVDARVLELDQICIHVPRGFLAVVEPGDLVRRARAIVVRT